MFTSAIDIDNLDEGVDRKQLTQLKQRFLALNEQRYARMLGALTERQQTFLRLLPLLFHVNHPLFPGYISGVTPAGLAGYKPDKEELRTAKIFARSFQYVRDLGDQRAAIDALFVMGSVGTIGQSDASDLDIWVCYAEHLSTTELQTLQHKTELISRWAAQQIRLEMHCFLMRPDQFSENRHQDLSSEGSGSAQHYLLLDEFYRTALWLGGKVPLWWFVPASQERHYQQYTQILLNKRFIKKTDVIDFGGLPEIPVNEFLGAGIWQLYKAIESPYKSVLKLLLLEIYASNLQADGEHSALLSVMFNEPLAIGFKRALYLKTPDADELDPYVMVYRRIENYLLRTDQLQRMELVRRCFYFKANKPLSRSTRQLQKSWQRLLLEKLVESWGWGAHELHFLDDRIYWKAPHVIIERAALVNELGHSYRLLTDLHRNIGDSAVISNDELIILGRKLRAAFERKAGKIESINPSISRDLSEAVLCFVGGSHAEDDWKVFRGSQQDVALRQVDSTPIKRAHSLLELLLWCHINGVCISTTKVDITGNSFLLSGVQKQQLLQLITQWIPLPLALVAHQHFTEAAHTERLLLIFNLGVEPQHELQKRGLQMLSSQHDALGYSGFKENLVISVDVVSINSWGEVVCRHYAQDALINGLLHYLRLLPPGKQQRLPELTIRCFSSVQGNNIEKRLTELWQDIVHCYYMGAGVVSSRYVLEMGDEYLLLQLVHQQPHIYRFNHYDKLLHALTQPQSDYSPIVIDRYALLESSLRLMVRSIKHRGIYIFYEVDGDCANINVFDEKGSLFSMRSPYHNQQSALRPLLRFIHSVMHRQQVDAANCTLKNDIYIYELLHTGKSGSATLEPRVLPKDSRPLQCITIKVIADVSVDNALLFTLYCDEQEFSSLIYGNQLFASVARYIRQRRQSGELYPCYITDLDLSLCSDFLAAQTGLQLSHYLRIKVDLERALTQHLH